MRSLSPTPHEPRLARVAAEIADATRARMLSYLMSGEFASAGELARAASVAPPTASGHLRRLVDSGFVVCEPRGRHRYYRLADADIAHALEALAMVAERGVHEKAWSSPQRQRLRFARCCYGHLAGRLGVGLFESLLQREQLRPQAADFALTDGGRRWLSEIGIDADAIQPRGRGPHGNRLGYACLDWSERRDHLAGPLASQLLAHFLARDWLRRRPGERSLALTPGGAKVLGPSLIDVGVD